MQIKRTQDAGDMSLIEKMGEEWFAATGLAGEMDWDHMVRQTQQVLDIGGYFGLAMDGELAVGGLIGLTSPDPFTGDLGAHELAWYVDPEYRSGGVATALLADFEKWAKESDATTMYMVSLTSSPKELGQFFVSQGFKPIEARWGKSL